MLICIVCGKVIANRDPSTIRYGGCSSCSLEDVREAMLVYKHEGMMEGMLGGQKRNALKDMTEEEMDALESCLEDDDAAAFLDMRKMLKENLVSRQEFDDYIQHLKNKVKGGPR